MIAPFDKTAFIQNLHHAVEGLDHASNLGQQLGNNGIRRIFLVACGAPYQAMSISAYWASRIATSIEILRYYPAELIHQDPLSLDQNSLVVLSSHSGKTKEIIRAMEHLSGKECITLAITQHDQSLLSQSSDFTLSYGTTKQGYYAGYMLFQSFLSGVLKESENWKIHDALLSSLTALPESLADVSENQDANTVELANRIKNESILYIAGAGPVYSTAYVIASCILMEMQWIHAFPIRAAEFFHGPFEVMDGNRPLINLIGEDPSRPEAERIEAFCKKVSIPTITYDSKQFPMVGIDERIRPILAPFFLDAAMIRMAEHLADLRKHPLSKRRYMGKLEY